jgi:hypothetical protein
MEPQPQNGFRTGREDTSGFVALRVSAGTSRNPAAHAAGYNGTVS